MTEHAIKPEKITKPIQLLGAWLAGLFSIDSCFLFAAANMATGSWEARALVVAAILNVPVFLAAVFLLQTKFRPELQEDSFYASYLSRKTNEVVSIGKDDAQWAGLNKRLSEIENRISSPERTAAVAASKLEGLVFGINKHIPDQQKLGEKLLERGVLGYSTFGADSPPQDRTVGISRYLPRDIVREVVALAQDLQFDGYSMWDPREEVDDTDVLLGAYGGPDFRFTKKALDRTA